MQEEENYQIVAYDDPSLALTHLYINKLTKLSKHLLIRKYLVVFLMMLFVKDRFFP